MGLHELQADEEAALMRLASVSVTTPQAGTPTDWATRIAEANRRAGLYEQAWAESPLPLPTMSPIAAGARSVTHDVIQGWL